MESRPEYNRRLNPDEIFEQNTGIPKTELIQLERTMARSPETGIEVKVEFHHDTSSLIISAPVVSIDALAYMAQPAADFIENTRPDLVVGCDRGGRFFTLAVHNTISKREGSEHTTLDGDFDFARLSKSMDKGKFNHFVGEIRRVLLKNIVESERRDKSTNGKRPKITFIDDWIASGKTREMIYTALDELDLKDKVDVDFILMCNTVADVPWERDEDMIGVEYVADGPKVIPSESAKSARKKLYNAITNLTD